MKILFLLAGKDLPSTKLRVLEHLKRLDPCRWQWDLAYLPKTPLKRLWILTKAMAYQGIFIQKKLLHIWEISLLRALNPRIVFDFDDAIMYPALDPSLNTKKALSLKVRNSYKNFQRMMVYCQTIIAGNSFLQQEALRFNKNVYPLPTPVDTDRYNYRATRAPGDQIIIGWYGSPGNIPYLQRLGDVLEKITQKYPQVALKIISQKFPELPGVRAIHKYWREEEEVEEIGSFDIGLMPLGDDLWSRGKCGFKLLKYMALGMPVVATVTEANRDIVANGIEGFLVSQPQEWLEKLTLLIENPGLRLQMGRAAREKIETSFSYQALSPLFNTILEKAYLG
ncbi:MAG: hypothetical protein A3G93_06450 [Nitrospinae bacterium RIFCSPLOWO2_12_FULL_45_22]|nr:MAG: hypothetical protein A3G93_06450 [Nitrospinae bacterium RIFCSPLOWO2_12_FULL_45_22]